MRRFAYGLLVKLTLITVGFGTIGLANGMRQDFDILIGPFVSAKLEAAEDYLGVMLDVAPEEVILAPALSPVPEDTEALNAILVPASPPDLPETCLRPESRSDSVVIGDEVRLRFFETGSSVATEDANHAGTFAYERLDLSGVYSVGQDGAISIPLVGRVDVLGRHIGCLEPLVARAAFGFVTVGLRVSATFGNRPRVIAQGDLRSPGRYDYLPGMTVEQLLTLAGAPVNGVLAASASNEPYLDARKTELERALMGNLVKWYRVSAALNGKDTIHLNDAQFAAAREVLGAQRIEAELMALSADMDLRRASTSQLQIELEKINRLIDQKKKHSGLVEWQLRKVIERHSFLTNLQSRGVVKMDAVTEAELSKMALERMLLESQSQSIELEARAIELASSVELQRLRDRRTMAMELRNISEEADGFKGQLLAVNRQLGNAPGSNGGTYVAVFIDRAGKKYAKRFEAKPTTLIFPGDVVTTKLLNRAAKEELARTELDPKFFGKRVIDE